MTEHVQDTMNSLSISDLLTNISARVFSMQEEIRRLKKQQVVWHDLCENPNDLPKEYDVIRKASGIYKEKKAPHVVLNQYGEEVYCIRDANNPHKAWYWSYASSDKGIVEEHVITWCEIPKFSKTGKLSESKEESK